jgi:hypothetical protein
VGEDNQKLDVHTTKSERRGVAGFFESALRQFKTLGFVLMLSPIALMYISAMGISLTPGILLFKAVHKATAGSPFILKELALGCSIAASFIMYGMSIIFVVLLFNKLLPLK